LSSIIQHLRTGQFARLRMGIGYPPDHQEAIDYVLEEFKKEEKDRLGSFIENAAACSLLWVTDGVKVAMDRHNRKNKPDV